MSVCLSVSVSVSVSVSLSLSHVNNTPLGMNNVIKFPSSSISSLLRPTEETPDVPISFVGCELEFDSNYLHAMDFFIDVFIFNFLVVTLIYVLSVCADE